jgi:hypothetical protein
MVLNSSDNILHIINISLLIILFSIFIYILIKNADLYYKVNNLEYDIYKPLFPFELKSDDPYSIQMYQKKFINQESPYISTSSARFI